MGRWMKGKGAGSLGFTAVGIFYGIAGWAQAGEGAQVMVKYQTNATPAAIGKLEGDLALRRVRVLPASGLVIYRADSIGKATAMASRLAADPAVASAEVDQTVKILPPP